MKRKLIVLISVISLGIGIFLLVQFIFANAQRGEGMLKVTANVSVRVLLDNRDIGKTPLEKKIPVGEYSLRLIPEGSYRNFSSWQGTIKVYKNILTYVNRALSETEITSSGEILWLEKISSAKGELTVISTPEGARVFLNEESKGMTPVTIPDLPEGDYSLLVSSPGFESRSISVKITSGYKLYASFSLALSPGQLLLDAKEEDSPFATAGGSLRSSSPGPSPRVSPTPTPSKIARPTSSPTPTRAPSPSSTASQQTRNVRKVEVLDTPTGFLRVREEPSTSSSEVGRAKLGDRFSVLDVRDVGGVSWYKIAFTETQDGWISGQYAKKIE